MTARAVKPCVAILGAGRAALGMAGALERSGVRIAGMWSRRRKVASADLAGIVRLSDVVLLCVPDRAIGHVAGRLARLPAGTLRGRAVLHTSGAVGPEALAVLRPKGAHVGCLHPLVSFPASGRRVVELKGITFAVDGDRVARRRAVDLVRALRGVTVRLAVRHRPAYHLAATLVATGLAVMVDAGTAVARRSLPWSEARARAALVALARSVLANLGRDIPRHALTGPVPRGDLDTVRRHLAALRARGVALDELYRAVSLRAVAMARADRRLDAQSARRLRRTLRFD